MKREQAELFAEDISLVAQGIERFFARIEADPELRSKPLGETVHAIQESGVLTPLIPLFEAAMARAGSLIGAGLDLGFVAAARNQDPN